MNNIIPQTRPIIECFLLFGLLPPAVAFAARGRPFVLLLWPAALACAAAMRRTARVEFNVFWNWKPVPAGILKVLARFALFAAPAAGLTAAMAPEQFMSFPRTRPMAWLLVMLLYPLLSVYPQCVIYRAFFFTRYRRLFGGETLLVISAACAFAWTHIVFLNAPALLLSFAGGLLFARTYSQSRSLALSFIEHALYGCAIFTIGLGRFFFHAATHAR